MTALVSAGPVQCAPWCQYGDGHGDMKYLEDQWCGSEILRVELSLPQVGEYEPGEAWIYAYRSPVQADAIVVDRGEMPGLRFTLVEARELVEALQLLLGQVQAA